MAAPGDFPSGSQGEELTVRVHRARHPVSLASTAAQAFKPNEAVSFMVETQDQAETDRYWDAIVGNGGTQQAQCGWCKDRWGFSWQITPRQLSEGMADPDRVAAKRVFEAMMTMRKIDVATIEAARRANG